MMYMLSHNTIRLCIWKNGLFSTNEADEKKATDKLGKPFIVKDIPSDLSDEEVEIFVCQELSSTL